MFSSICTLNKNLQRQSSKIPHIQNVYVTITNIVGTGTTYDKNTSYVLAGYNIYTFKNNTALTPGTTNSSVSGTFTLTITSASTLYYVLAGGGGGGGGGETKGGGGGFRGK